MKKMKLTRSLLAACSIVALTAVMYGCVHSGSEPPAMEMPGGTALAHAGLAGGMVVNPGTYHITGASDALSTALETFEGMTDGYESGDMVTLGDLDLRCAAGPCGITVNDDGSFTTTGTITVVAMGGTHPKTPAEIAADEAAAEEVRKAAEAAATKSAGTKETAIAAEAAQTTDAGLGGSARSDTEGDTTAGDASDDPYTVDIERDRDGTTVEIADPAAADDDPKFVDQMADLSGGRTMFVRTMDADEDGNVVEEVVMVGTDIKAPTATDFEKVYELNARKDGAAESDNNPFDTLDLGGDLAASDGEQAMVLARVMSGSFTASAAAVLSFDFDVAATNDTDEASEVAGTYDGAMGTYRCNGTALCSVTVNDEGEITAMSDGWIFTPDTGVKVDVPDSDYLHYGFWLMKTTDKDGVLTYNEVETFAGASVAASDGTQLDTVTGSASYSGDAVGVYVKNVYVASTDGKQEIDYATSGHFIADANLTAYFSQTLDDTETTPDEAGQFAPNLLNTITGSISNFVLSGGESNEWAVNLQGERADGENTFSGTANGGGAAGTFSGTYYGATPETESATDSTTRVAPGSVAGEFNANFSNGSVAGAFGADKD